MRVLLNFARLPDEVAHRLAMSLSEHGLQVVATMSHKGEDPRRFHPDAAAEWWHDYSPAAFVPRWLPRAAMDDLDPDVQQTLLALVVRSQQLRFGAVDMVARARLDLSRAVRILETHRPDALISLDLPESGLDFLVGHLSRQRGIPALWNRYGMTSLSHIVSTDGLQPWIDSSGRLDASVISAGPDRRGAADAVQQAAAAIAGFGAAETLDPFIQLARGFPRIRRSRKEQLLDLLGRRSQRLAQRRRQSRPQAGMHFLSALLSEHDALAAEPEDSFLRGHRVCLVALHYQPELSSTTLASWTVNQFEIVKFLSDNLPDDWVILVKEHPSTFAPHSKTSSNYRPVGLYQRIAALPRVRLLPLDFDTRPALSSHRIALVATITGNIGKEALALGVPVIHFGRAVYTNFPGAFWIHQPDPSLLCSALDCADRLTNSSIGQGFMRCAALLEEASFHFRYEPTLTGRVEGTAESVMSALPAWLSRIGNGPLERGS